MFLGTGIVFVLAGGIALVALLSSRPIFPGVLTPLILIGGGGILLAFAAAHYVVERRSALRMNRLLAAVTLAATLAGIGFYFASSRSMEAYLNSNLPADLAGHVIVSQMKRSELCGVLALVTFLANAIVTSKKHRSGVGI